MTSQRWGENIWKTYILIMTWTQYTSKSYNSMVRQPNKKCANALQLNKSRKSCLTSLVTKGMQMKTMMIYSYIPTRKNKVKNKCHQRHGTTVTLIKCVCVCVCVCVCTHASAQTCTHTKLLRSSPPLCDPSLPGSSVHGNICPVTILRDGVGKV